MNEDHTNDTYAIGTQRTLIERIWLALGFGMPAYLDMDDLDQPGWAPAYLESSTFIKFDWRDRLRVLVSGRVYVCCKSKTDVVIGRAITRSQVSVLAPGAELF